MVWQLLSIAGASVYLWRDVCLLSLSRSPWRALAALQLAAFLMLGWVVESLSREEAGQLLSPARTVAAALLHGLLWAGLVIGRRRNASWTRSLAMFPAPVFLLAQGALLWMVLQRTPLSSGALAGLLGALAWIAVTHGIAALKKQMAPTSWDVCCRFAAASQLSVLALFGFDRVSGTGGAMTVKAIHDLLEMISGLFLLPTLLGTLVAFGWCAFLLGQFFAEAVQHRANRKLLACFYAGSPTEARFYAIAWKGRMARYSQARQNNAALEVMIEKFMVELEHSLRGRIERLGIMSKVGPMLGLVGTLIPLQPALAGLARGDLQLMGANLQIGFTTTVLGLVVGGCCYALSVILRQWYQQDLTDMHFLNALWANSKESANEPVEPQPVSNVLLSGDQLAPSGGAFRGV